MKLALLKGNRFNPWHLQAFMNLEGHPDVTAFRAESEIQQHFHGRDDGSLDFAFERIYFKHEVGDPVSRCLRKLRLRYGLGQPEIAPFHERLQGFDIIQSWELFTDWSEQAVEARERYGIPLAVMVWDNLPFNMEPTARRRDLKQRVGKAADVLIVHSERSRRALMLEGLPQEKIVKMMPGVDLEVFSPGADKRNRGDEFVILFVGWLLPRKGIDFLLFALRELLNDSELNRYKIRLEIVGSGPGRERVEALIGRLGLEDACRFAGSQSYGAMPDIYRGADLFVLPSIATPQWQEQFGMSLIEAMACGTPVVSTLSGAIAEIACEGALLCQPNDFVALYDTIRRVMVQESLREELGHAGRTRCERLFDLARLARELSTVYAGLIS